MIYTDVLNAYIELRDYLTQKKQAIIKKDLDNLNKIDESLTVLCEKIKKFSLETEQNNFSKEQKQELKKIGEEIKVIEENNEILIKHSLGVINGLLSGILNISLSDSKTYNAKGVSCKDETSLDISSITEEA